MGTAITALRLWGRRRWTAALAGALSAVLVLGVPTDLVPNPVFARQIEAPWWAWPAMLVTSVLSGMLFATYVRDSADGASEDPLSDSAGRRGAVGGLLAYFAVGCPVCNKLALLALGYTGALKWFAPVQPYLGALAVVVLMWALWVRLRGQVACPVTPSQTVGAA
jgi:hypothetical protein